MKIRIIRDGVTDGRAMLDIGLETEVDDKSGAALVRDGFAEVMAESAEQVSPENPVASQTEEAVQDANAAPSSAGVTAEQSAEPANVEAPTEQPEQAQEKTDKPKPKR